MIGRELELGAILDAFDRAVAGRGCRLVTLLGEAGVGKSRLVLEALRELGDRGSVLRGRCLPYGEGITFWPVAEAVRRAAGISDECPPEEARGRIADLLEGVERSDRIAKGVAELIGLGEGVLSAEEAGARAALELSRDAGQERIADRVRFLTDLLLSGITAAGYSTPTPLEWQRRAGVVCIDVVDVHQAVNSLLEEGIEVGYEVEYMRVDPHAYNTEEEILRLIERLPAVAPPRR